MDRIRNILRAVRGKSVQIFLGTALLLAFIFGGNIVPSPQEKSAAALEPTAWCHTADPNFPGGYEYVPAGVNVWVLLSDGQGNEVGQISGASVHAQALRNGECARNPSCPFYPRTAIDGPGCGQSGDGTTDSRGFTNLEPLNCGHNNFAFSVVGGLPPNVYYVGSRVNDGPLNAQDISNLALTNGTVTVIKLYYQPPAQAAYSSPYTSPYSSPYASPYASPPNYPTPYTSPYTSPYATPYVTPIGSQYTTPYTSPYSSPYTTPYTTPSISSALTLPVIPTIVLSPSQQQNQHQAVNITQAAAPATVVVQQPTVVSAPAPKVLPKTGADALLSIPLLLGLSWFGRIVKRRFRLA